MKNLNIFGIKKRYNKFKQGFTLVEILITIGIIGVVAALTIPTLIQNSNSKKFVAQLKKSLSTLNQAVIGAQAQYDIDYSNLSLASQDSTCASDTVSGGKLSLCGLFNNTLAGQTYLGKYGNVKAANNTTPYKAEVSSISIDNFLFFSFADGAFVAFNPNMKNCGIGIGNSLTTEVIEEKGLTNCIGFIDVNGPTPPNREVKCAEESTIISVDKTCKVTNGSMGDIFPVIFHDGHVHPATNAALSAFLGGNGKENPNGSNNDENEEVAPKMVTFKGGEYEYLGGNNKYSQKDSEGNYISDGGYYKKDDNGNYVDAQGKVFTKNADGNYVGSDGSVYDENMNLLGQNYKGNWFAFKGDVLVRDMGNGTYKGKGGMTYTKTNEGLYKRSDGTYFDENFNTIGKSKNNNWYDFKNGLFVREDANGNYISDSGKTYTKNTDGNYVNGKYVYDSNLNPVGATHNGVWYDYKGQLYVRDMGDGTYKGFSMTYKQNEDGNYERSDGNVYDSDFYYIGHK